MSTSNSRPRTSTTLGDTADSSTALSPDENCTEVPTSIPTRRRHLRISWTSYGIANLTSRVTTLPPRIMATLFSQAQNSRSSLITTNTVSILLFLLLTLGSTPATGQASLGDLSTCGVSGTPAPRPRPASRASETLTHLASPAHLPPWGNLPVGLQRDGYRVPVREHGGRRGCDGLPVGQLHDAGQSRCVPLVPSFNSSPLISSRPEIEGRVPGHRGGFSPPPPMPTP